VIGWDSGVAPDSVRYIAAFAIGAEILGTFGIAIVLAIHGFHHGFGFLTTTQNVQHVTANPLGLDFGGSWIAAALVAVLAPVYIFYGFESAGDISEETRNAGRQVPRAMRLALIWGGIASFVLTAALLLAIAGGRQLGRQDHPERRYPLHPQLPAERRNRSAARGSVKRCPASSRGS
jgi:amino acid transporter